APAGGTSMFTDNETNPARVPGARRSSPRRFFKDAFHRRIVRGDQGATNSALVGTKAAIDYRFPAIPPGGTVELLFPLTDQPHPPPPLGGRAPPHRPPPARARPLLPPHPPPPPPRRRAPHPAPGFRRPALDQDGLPLRRRRLARRRHPPPPPPPTRAAGAQPP